ncbi:MAG TPA: hypothetical protein VFL34_06145 [Candidatus Sulfotelmatobacter sp.]|nr:hypothetical protein [Candidatus Sulfotelmatobacter sp.]
MPIKPNFGAGSEKISLHFNDLEIALVHPCDSLHEHLHDGMSRSSHRLSHGGLPWPLGERHDISVLAANPLFAKVAESRLRLERRRKINAAQGKAVSNKKS